MSSWIFWFLETNCEYLLLWNFFILISNLFSLSAKSGYVATSWITDYLGNKRETYYKLWQLSLEWNLIRDGVRAHKTRKRMEHTWAYVSDSRTLSSLGIWKEGVRGEKKEMQLCITDQKLSHSTLRTVYISHLAEIKKWKKAISVWKVRKSLRNLSNKSCCVYMSQNLYSKFSIDFLIYFSQ